MDRWAVGSNKINLQKEKNAHGCTEAIRYSYTTLWVSWKINVVAMSQWRGKILQGLFARVGSSDPVRVLRLFHNKYTGYCCIHLVCRATYNLSLPRLSANYYGLPTTVQLRAAHESRCSLVGVSRSTAQVLYCTCLEWYNYGTVQSSLCRGTFRGKVSANY